eukprot:Rhum_TRINITY_DN14117_c20_g1::Rhum_TRINITY_DN14117_c20_g1_i1::g.72205::m.72205
MARSSSLYVLLCVLVVPAGVFLLVAAPRRRSAGGEQRLTGRRAGLEVEAAQRARDARARNVARDLRRFGLLEKEEEEEEGRGKRREEAEDGRHHRHRDSSSQQKTQKKRKKKKNRHEQPDSSRSSDDDDDGSSGGGSDDVVDRRSRSSHARRAAEEERAEEGEEEEEGEGGKTAAQKKRRRRRQEEDEEGDKHSKKKKEKTKKTKKKKRVEDEEDDAATFSDSEGLGSVIVGTSLKSCEPGSVLCSRQWNSVQSWALCDRVHAVHVFAAPGDTFDLSGIDAAKVRVHRRVKEEGSDDEESDGGGSDSDDDDPHVVTVSAKSRIPLLSSIVCTLTKEAAALAKRLRSSRRSSGNRDDAAAATAAPSPVTLVYANGDIVFPPHQLGGAVALLEASFKEYFAVGHRRTAEVGAKLFSGGGHGGWAEWAGSAEGRQAVGGGAGGDGAAQHDRTDAEDYFVWSDGYFPDACSFPGFRIGRPAFDNWWVHKAVVGGKPVVDLTNALAAVHQKHDYTHLDKAAAGGKAANKYWATADQQRNYALGKANGGWRFGLIEFSPFVASPSDCAQRNMVAQAVECRVVPNKGWLPPAGTGLSLSGYAKYAHRALAPLPTQLRQAEGRDGGEAEVEADGEAGESEGHHRHHKGHKRHKKTHRKHHHDDGAV